MSQKRKSNKAGKLTKFKNSKTSFLCNIWEIIINKKDTKGQYTKTTLVTLVSFALNTLAIILFTFAVVGLYQAIKLLFTPEWNTTNSLLTRFLTIAVFLAFCFVGLIFAIVLRGFANEIEREDDKNYIVSVFSGISTFFALIVALIALLKE